MQSDVKVLKFQKRWQRKRISPKYSWSVKELQEYTVKNKCVGVKFSEICWKEAQLLLKETFKMWKIWLTISIFDKSELQKPSAVRFSRLHSDNR